MHTHPGRPGRFTTANEKKTFVFSKIAVGQLRAAHPFFLEAK